MEIYFQDVYLEIIMHNWEMENLPSGHFPVFFTATVNYCGGQHCPGQAWQGAALQPIPGTWSSAPSLHPTP